MSELRLYLRRDSFMEGTDCAWSLLDDKGHVQSSGNQLLDLPRARRCNLVLASDLVLTVKTALPDLPERRLAPLLSAAAEAATLSEADALHAVIMGRAKDGEAILAVVEEAWFHRILARLAELGLRPESALPEYLLLPCTEGNWSVGWRSSNSVARFGRSEGAALDDGEPPVGLILALAQRGRPVAVNVYLDDNAGSPDLGRWRAALQTSVETVGAWDWRAAAWPDLPNLLQGKHAPGLKRMDWTRLARPVVWGVIALVAIQLVGMSVDCAMLSHESASIRREMHVLAEQALPANSAIVDPPWQLRERLLAMQTVTGDPSPNALVGLLDRLSQAWPTAGNIQVQSLSYEGDTLSAILAEADTTWLDQLKEAAATQGLTVGSYVDKDKTKGIHLSIRSIEKGGRHEQ